VQVQELLLQIRNLKCGMRICTADPVLAHDSRHASAADFLARDHRRFEQELRDGALVVIDESQRQATGNPGSCVAPPEIPPSKKRATTGNP